MKHRTKFSEEHEQAAAHLIHPQANKEFASVEELLRFDAAQTNVPPEIAARLNVSARQSPPSGSSKPWWKSLFGL